MRRFVRGIPVLATALALAGCNAFGPRAVQGTRVAYNEVLQRTQAEQLLLNVVRLRYVDVPMFLEVSSVNTQFEFRTSADASVGGEFGDSLSEYSGSGGLGFTVVEKPTVSYVPLQGDDFVKQIMAPVDLDTIILMTRGGWSTNRMLRVCAQSLCGLPNAPEASGPAPDYEPVFSDFQEAVKLMRELQRARVGGVKRADDGSYLLHMDDSDPRSGRLREMLGLHDGVDFPIRIGARREPNVLTVETRSLLGAMFYLSQGIDVPAPHAEQGLVAMTPGMMWDNVTDELFHVRTSQSRPANATVAVRYRDWWYYIDDSDVNSKGTFAMLSFLFAIQSGGRDSRGPALTIGL